MSFFSKNFIAGRGHICNMDFFKIIERSKRNETEIFPDFQTGEVSDLLCRGKSFYAVWNEEKGMWSTNENDVQKIVDKALWDYVSDFKKSRNYDGILNVKTLKSDSSGMWNRFTNYTRRFPDSEVQLDNKLTFLNTEVKKTDYVSKRLNYAIEEGDHSAWDELVGKLYAPSEKEKIEWAIGAMRRRSAAVAISSQWKCSRAIRLWPWTVMETLAGSKIILVLTSWCLMRKS